MKFKDLLSGEILDIGEPAELREMPLPGDNWYPADIDDNDYEWGTAPLQLFALIDDGGRDGERWIPVEREG